MSGISSRQPDYVRKQKKSMNIREQASYPHQNSMYNSNRIKQEKEDEDTIDIYEKHENLLSEYKALQVKCDKQLDYINELLNSMDIQAREENNADNSKDICSQNSLAEGDTDANILYESLLSDYKVLQAKCDGQLDYINELLNAANIQAGDEYQYSKDMGNCTRNTGLFHELFSMYYDVISNIIKDNMLYQPKRVTANALQYRMLRYSVFTQYLSDVTGQTANKNIIDKWADFGLIETNKNGQIIFTYSDEGKSVAGVRVKKEIIDTVRECMTCG